MAIELWNRMTQLFAAKPEVKLPARVEEELARNAMAILSRWTAPAKSFNPADDLIGLKGMEVYEKMRHDDQVKAALQFKKSATLSTGWTIHPASDKKPDVDAADLVTWCLENLDPLYGSIDDIHYEMLSALDFGFSCSELVLKKLDEGPHAGKIGLKTIKVRKPHEFIFDVDEFDNLKKDGLRQSWTDGKGMPIDKFLIFSYQREFGNFRGISDLRAAYRAWWLKDNLWSWTATYAERFAIPLRTATYPPGAYPEGHPMRTLIAAIHNAIDNLQANTALTFPNDFAVQFHEASGQGVNVLKFLFDHCNQSITRSILMPSQLGFSAEGSSGSYARSKVQFDAFMLVIDDLRRDLAQDVMNGQLIPRLVGWNIGGLDALPKFEWLPFTESDEINLMNAWMLATQYGLVTPTPEDEAHIRSATKFPDREIDAKEEKAVRAKNDAAVKKIQDQADAVLNPKPRKTGPAWGAPADEWGADWGQALSAGEDTGTEDAVPTGWGAESTAAFAADPEFESKHPRGRGAQGGQFIEKPGGDAESKPDVTMPDPVPVEWGERGHKNPRDEARFITIMPPEMGPFGVPLKDAVTGAEIPGLVMHRFGVWGDLGRGKAEVTESGSDLRRLMWEHNVPPDRVIQMRRGGGGRAITSFAADPEFEAKHPRGPEGTPAGGKFIEKPDGVEAQDEDVLGKPFTGSLLEFEQQALTNMHRLSRTAKGISDTSSSADKPKLVTEGDALAKQTEANFRDAIRIVWAKRNDPMDTPERVEALVKSVAATVSRGLLPDGASLWRQHETNPKFGQTPVKYIQSALKHFYADFAERLSNPSDDPIATAAWAERMFDAKIHGLTDGAGRTTKLLSAFVLARAGLPQPVYPDKKTYYAEITRSPESWERFYRGLFPKPSIGERLRNLPARAVNWLRESERIARKPVPSGGASGWGTLGGYASLDDATRYFAVDPEFEAKHPRLPGGSEEGGQWAKKAEGMPEQPLAGVVVGDGGVTSDLDVLRVLNPRTQPHEFAQAYTLALAAAGEDRARVGVVVEMLPPELRDLLTPTFVKYSDANGRYTPERAAWHEQIIQKYLNAYQPHEMVVRALERGDMQPTMIVLAGGTGAGKTTTLEFIDSRGGQSGVNVGADDIKMKDLPEWAQLAASDYWEAGAGVLHEESSYIAKQLLNRAMDAKKDIVYDATLRNREKAMRLIDKAKNAGYKVQLIYVDTDKELALSRAKTRANDTKRWVPENFARVSHDQAPLAFREYSELLDRWMVFRSGQHKGETPRRIAVAGQGQHIAVEDQATWNEFIRKMGGLLPSTAVHSRRLWSEKPNASAGISPGTKLAPSDSKLLVSSSLSTSPKSAEATHEVDFAQVVETLDTLEADAVTRMRATLARMLNALQNVVSKKIATNDLSLGFVKALDLKYRAEMTAVVRDFLGLAYRAGKTLGASVVPTRETFARRTHRTPQGLAPEKALKFFDEKSLWITGVLKQRLVDEAKGVLYNAIKGGTASPTVIQQLREVFDPYLGDDTALDPDKAEQVMPYRLETILRTNATEAYNEGMKDSVQQEVEDGYVIAFRSSAVLDARTTEVCEFLHDKCFRPNSDELEVFTPPRHFNCRSMLVPVTADEGPVEFITPEDAGAALGMIPPGFGGRQKG